ncbi:hypothetical protein ILUMI_23858 [Ignelater luminosus]|uniref:TrmE-type G domain-containing protein n=1 Tax=Ignelater luminosus TaxID=2038154 RepID=A0A8K0C806_IGNLU|nr:hypothetical protein ILUMI_23858 [Ignelater luminosus]
MLRFKVFKKYLYGAKFISTFSNVDTIFAVSSGQGKCGVAVIRVSGPHAGTALKLLTGVEVLQKPRYAILKNIKNPQNGEVLDKGLVLWFPGPRSFTGEDSCELQVHGGLAVINAILKALGSVKNLRLAEPGEFTRRAFYNGKLDLTEVEGIADLLAAETEVQRKQAFLQTEGYLSKIYQEWRSILIKCVANLEAYIDFEETDTLETNITNQVIETIQGLITVIKQYLNDGRRGECLRNGVQSVILGEPNVGKSSLLNILCQRPAAIVTPLAGTTRDILEITLDISGYPLILADTAGLHSHTKDIIEKEGIQRALKAYESADLVFLVIDCLKYLDWYKLNCEKNFIDFIKLYTQELNINGLVKPNGNSISNIFDKQCVIIANKIDLIKDTDMHVFKNLNVNLVSCKFENGMELLLKEIEDKLKILCGEPSKEHPSMSHARHRQHLTQCLKHLENTLYLSNNSAGYDLVLMAEEMRKALKQLGKITGTVTTEQLLDVIFKEFCIGK